MEWFISPLHVDVFLDRHIEHQFNCFNSKFIAFNPTGILMILPYHKLLALLRVCKINFIVFIDKELSFSIFFFHNRKLDCHFAFFNAKLNVSYPLIFMKKPKVSWR